MRVGWYRAAASRAMLLQGHGWSTSPTISTRTHGSRSLFFFFCIGGTCRSPCASNFNRPSAARYTLERELGGGGMSRVFVAEELRLQAQGRREGAVARARAGISVERFEREIRPSPALQQANIVPVLSAGDTDGLPFYTMPFVEGESLRARLGAAGRFAVARGRSASCATWRRRSPTRTSAASCTATSSPTTCSCPAARRSSPTSASPRRSARRAPQPAVATLTQIGTSHRHAGVHGARAGGGRSRRSTTAPTSTRSGRLAYELLAGHPAFAGLTPQRMLAAHVTDAPTPIAGSPRRRAPQRLPSSS